MERRGLQTASMRWHCPFDRSRTPSFQVSLGERSWSCSTCGAGGDAAALVMRIKGMAFRDAVAWLDDQEDFRSTELVGDNPKRLRGGNCIRLLRCAPSTTRNRPAIMDGDEGMEKSHATQSD